MTQRDWSRGDARAIGVFLNGEEIPMLTPQGEPVVDDSFLLLFNGALRADRVQAADEAVRRALAVRALDRGAGRRGRCALVHGARRGAGRVAVDHRAPPRLVSLLLATYRLQLRPGFGFREARELVPYLTELGVSHLYLSPIMEAQPGSTHGYDVVDPTRVSEQLGGEDAFRELARAGLGVVLDVVPNHMAASGENRFWADEELRAKVFDFDPASGWYRRFFTIDELAGVRVEDPEVFELTQRKALELVQEGLVDGLRVDHPDGLADPRGYLERLRDEGVEHVWVEKILEPGERLRDWPVEGTTGYEFANDVHGALRRSGRRGAAHALVRGVDGRDALVRRDRGRGEARAGARRSSRGSSSGSARSLTGRWRKRPRRCTSTARTSSRGRAASRTPTARRSATLPEPLRRILLLEERGHDEFVTRFQQTTGPVMAKGVEDTAFYRYYRLTALNEVGGDPGRFSLPVEEFHRANLERAARFPNHLLATQTHDTKRSGDVRARIVALAALADEWVERRAAWRALDDPHEDELLWQTLVGAWPIEHERVEAYLEKALREAKVNTNWVEPNEEHERRVKEAARRAIAEPPRRLRSVRRARRGARPARTRSR